MRVKLVKGLVALACVFTILLVVDAQQAETLFPTQVRQQLAGAKADPQVYIVIMEQMPAIAYDGGIEGFEPTTPGLKSPPPPT